MAVQNSFLVPYSASTAFECAIRTLKTFKITEKVYIDPTVFDSYNNDISSCPQ